MSKQVVTLKLYYGQPTYNATGQVTSKTEPIKLIYGSTEWENFVKHMVLSGIAKADVVKVHDLDKKEDVEDFTDIQDEVNTFFKAVEVPLTEDQKRIKELEDKINALTEAKPATEKPVVEKAKVSEAVKAAKENAKPATEK